jgi:chromate transporter
MARAAGRLAVSLGTALQICLLFGTASLLSVGGGNSVVPEIQLRAVDTYHWLSAVQFGDLFAIAQAAPGPSMLLVTLVGYKAAGVVGALLATVAMILPAGVVVHLVARFWQSSSGARWHLAMERGLAPVAIGLVAASGAIIARTTEHSPAQLALTAAATLVLCATKLNPLFLVAAAGLAGWLGLV